MSKLRTPSCWWTPDGAARTARSSPGKLWSTFHCRNLYSTRSRRCCLFCFLHLHLIDTIPQASLMEKSAFNNSFYYQLMQCSMVVRQWQLGSSKMQTQESQRPSFHTFIKNPIERHNSDKIPAAVRCAPCWTPAHAFLIYSTINHPPTDDYFSQPGPLLATAGHCWRVNCEL